MSNWTEIGIGNTFLWVIGESDRPRRRARVTIGEAATLTMLFNPIAVWSFKLIFRT